MLDEHTDAGFRHLVWLLDGGTLLGIHQHDRGVPDEHFSEFRVGLDHVGFACANRGELEKWMDRLNELGISHGGIVDAGYGFRAEFPGPRRHRAGVLRPAVGVVALAAVLTARQEVVVTDVEIAATSDGIPTGLEALERYLAGGHKVLVHLDSGALYGQGKPTYTNHVVVVTGVDTTAGVVHLNDSLDTHGDTTFSIDTFMKAWSTTDKEKIEPPYTMVVTVDAT